MSPQAKHSLVTLRLSSDLLDHAEPDELGLPFPELRCTFAGRSMIPDIAFLLAEHITVEAGGKVENPTFRPPDIHIEIVSPDQSVRKCREKLAFSTANGCPLGWLIDPERETVHVDRPGRRPMRVPDDGALEGDPVLPGYRLPLADLFGWLRPFPRKGPAPLLPPPATEDPAR